MRASESSASSSVGSSSASCSHACAGARQVVQRPLDQAGELAQVLGLQRRIGDHALDLGVEHPRQMRIVAERRVDLAQRVQRLPVVGIESDDLLEALGGAGRVLQRAELKLRDAGGGSGSSRRGSPRAGCAGPAPAPAPTGGPALLEDPLEAGEGVAVAGDRLQDLVRRPLPLGEVVGVLVADHQHPAQQADALLLRLGPLDLVVQQLGQADVVALALVDLDDQPHRHRVVRVVAQDLLVDLDRPPGIRQLLAVDLGHPAQDLGPRAGVGLARRPRARAAPPSDPSS